MAKRFGWDLSDNNGWGRLDYRLLGTSYGGRILKKADRSQSTDSSSSSSARGGDLFNTGAATDSDRDGPRGKRDERRERMLMRSSSPLLEGWHRRRSKQEAAVMAQAAARGLLDRRMMREVRMVEREAEVLAVRVAVESEAMRTDSRGRIGVGEELMRLLFRLDAVHNVREFRNRLTKKVLALQDAVGQIWQAPFSGSPGLERLGMKS